MFDKISKAFIKNKSKKQDNNQRQMLESNGEKIPEAIEDIKQRLNQEFELCNDITIREIEFGKAKTKLMVVFFEGFIDKQVLSQNVIEAILQFSEDTNNSDVVELLKKKSYKCG